MEINEIRFGLGGPVRAYLKMEKISFLKDESQNRLTQKKRLVAGFLFRNIKLLVKLSTFGTHKLREKPKNLSELLEFGFILTGKNYLLLYFLFFLLS
jgi:hypothetical protein